MPSFNRLHWLSLVGSFATLSACSLAVQPDPNRLLVDGARMDATSDGNASDGSRQDAGNDVATDTNPGDTNACGGDCNDNVPCTVDQCNPTTQMCTHTPMDGLCTNGQRCDLVRGCTSQGCQSNAQCDNQNVCDGMERCNNGACVSGTPMVCNNNRFCDGAETCDPTRGCQNGTAPQCDDGNACTVDSCDPNASAGVGACVGAPIDMDRDNAPAAQVGAMACAGGTDCDDNDGTVNPGAMEVCNGKDDNCDGITDNVQGGCRPMNDTCQTAQRISLTTGAAQMVTGTTLGAQDGVTSVCGQNGGPDVWFVITFPGNNDLLLEVTPNSPNMDSVLVVRDGCTAQTDIVCNDDTAARDSMATDARGSRIWLRPSPFASSQQRTIAVLVDSYNANAGGTFTLRALATNAIAANACGNPMLDVSAGGTIYGAVPLRFGSQQSSCNTRAGDGTEESFVYNGPAGRVDLTLRSTDFRPVLYARRGMCGSGTEVTCVQANGNTTTTNFNHMTGSSFLFVDAGFQPGNRYALDVVKP